MRKIFPALAAALVCCLSCVETEYGIGGNFIPENLKYTMVTNQKVFLDVDNSPTDSLSGYSSNWVTIGAIRDEDLGLTTRASVLYLMPLSDTLDFGKDPVFKRMHLAIALDSVNVADESQRNILQSVNVYSLKETVDPRYDYDCNADFKDKVDWDRSIVRNSPVINGKDSLSLDFTKEYASQFLSLTQDDLSDISKYKKKIKGFYVNTDIPGDNSGRINMFHLQLGYDSAYLTGNFAKLDISSTFNGVEKDSSYFFYLSPSKMFNVDSLLYNTAAGNLPQYALNLTSQDSRKSEKVKGSLCVEGGGGLKPHILAKSLKDQVRSIIEINGHNPDKVTLTKASLSFYYDAPDETYEGLKLFPIMLSPTVRMHGVDTTGGVSTKKVIYDGISDSSSSSENQGDINYSRQCYAPDITYHLQALLSADDSAIERGDYDIWLLIMAYRTIVTDSSASEMSDYYSALAYQQYYNNMYGGYGGYGYGGYGYGGYGGYGYDPYSNYYSYMMMANMYSDPSSSTSVSLELDKDRFYKALLCGKDHPDESRRPKLVFSYIIPNSY